ncbi:MAG: hypothetical protein M3126_11550 [Candidatus Eremiobacteraeota bacterium]|nr:hypothetical protein [Candidatus Eremiobacteraeota bacterium]
MLAFMLTVALNSAAVTLPPVGTYRYEAFINGKIIGKSSLTVSKTPAGTKIDESANIDLETGSSKAETSMILDNEATVSGYQAAYTTLERTMKLAVTFDRRDAIMATGTDKQTVPLGGSSKGFVILDAALVSGFFALPAQMRAFGGGDTTVLVPGTGQSTFLSTIGGDTPVRPADVPKSDASLSFAGEAPFVEWFDPHTLVADEVLLPGENLIIKQRR